MLALLLLASGSPAPAHEEEEDFNIKVRTALQVPAGHSRAFAARGEGVQIYTWSAASSSWVFQSPSAVLFEDGRRVVGIHYAGPTWQSTDGSKVVGSKLTAATVDADAIPWLLLKAASTAGSGIYADITFIQRLHTKGGLAPTQAGSFDGQQALVPYSAEYLFYHAH
jgi:hypothetical protein